MKNPWKTISSKMVYENQWFKIKEDSVIRPNGVPGTYFVIEKQPIVFIVPLTENNEIYLIGQYRYPTSTYSWEVPAGKSDNQEVLVAAKRELQEETGLTARDWTQIGVFQSSSASSDQLAYVFLARGLRQTDFNEQEEEGIMEAKKVPYKKVFRMISKGEIIDGKTITSLMLAGLWLSIIS